MTQSPLDRAQSFSDRFGIRLPILLAPMAGACPPALSIAVARELFEEAGVRAKSVRYVASQPWPFPASLMIACIAEVGSDRLALDRTELADAIWVDRPEVEAALAGAAEAPFQAPPHFAIDALTVTSLSWSE